MITEDDLELVLREEDWLPLIVMRDGLPQVNPQFNPSLSLTMARHEAEDVVGRSESLL